MQQQLTATEPESLQDESKNCVFGYIREICRAQNIPVAIKSLIVTFYHEKERIVLWRVHEI